VAVALSDKTRQGKYTNEVVKVFASKAMRTIGLAYRDFAALPPSGWKGTTPDVLNADSTDAYIAETQLTLVGIVGIEDPLRPDVPGAIAKCYRAGIDVRMCTGDNLATAVAIAAGCGILRGEHFTDGLPSADVTKLKKDRAMEGKEFRRRVHNIDKETGKDVFDQVAFDKIWPRLRVMARCDPSDKEVLANGLNKSLLFQDKEVVARLLKEEGIAIFPDRQVVAMTGDGTNDAPALKRADVGFAMGISGTQIAKDAADIILLDDNFSSIVTAAKWGRNVYDSICKFLQFQLTVNVAAITMAVIGAFDHQQSPIAATQMLWINLIMDSLASLALATEPPSEALLERPPVNRSDSIVSEQMWYNMLGGAMYQVGILVAIYFAPSIVSCEDGYVFEQTMDDFELPTPSQHYTVIFNAFVMMTLFNEINCRKLNGEINVFSGIHLNLYFVGIWFLTLFFQILAVALLGSFLSCFPGIKYDAFDSKTNEKCMADCCIDLLDKEHDACADKAAFKNWNNGTTYGICNLDHCQGKWDDLFDHNTTVLVDDAPDDIAGGLTLEQWGLCLLFGAGTLVWQQVINLVHRLTNEGLEQQAADHMNPFQAWVPIPKSRSLGSVRFGKGITDMARAKGHHAGKITLTKSKIERHGAHLLSPRTVRVGPASKMD